MKKEKSARPVKTATKDGSAAVLLPAKACKKKAKEVQKTIEKPLEGRVIKMPKKLPAVYLMDMIGGRAAKQPARLTPKASAKSSRHEVVINGVKHKFKYYTTWRKAVRNARG